MIRIRNCFVPFIAVFLVISLLIPITSSADAGLVPDFQLPDDPVYVTLDTGETLYLSIGESELREYVDFFRNEMNFSDAAIAGVLSNLQCESGFNVEKIGDMGAAYGLCQWRGARLDAMVNYCNENDLNPIKKEGQLAFLKHDLEENYIYPYDLLRYCEDNEAHAQMAVYFFCAYYEAPADPDSECVERVKICKELIYPTLKEWEKAERGW